jgi:hypothetical protein
MTSLLTRGIFALIGTVVYSATEWTIDPDDLWLPNVLDFHCWVLPLPNPAVRPIDHYNEYFRVLARVFMVQYDRVHRSNQPDPALEILFGELRVCLSSERHTERLDNTAFSTDKLLDKTIISIRDQDSAFTQNNDNLYGMLFICRIALHGGRQVDQRVATINTSQCNWDDWLLRFI